MDFVKQYIIQSISAASNSLRLTTPKIEVVALLRETIVKSENIEQDIKRMKKITELSTLAIRLNEIFNYLRGNQLDLFKLSDKFKEHSQHLIKDLSSMLDTVSPAVFKAAINKIEDKEGTAANPVSTDKQEGINVELFKRNPESEAFEKPADSPVNNTGKTETDIEKEKLILEDDKDEEDVFFQNYENEILKPIKQIDKMLKKLSVYGGEESENSPEELNNFAGIMKMNGELSAKIGFDIIANMHRIISKALLLIKTRDLMPGKDVIESMRACLIVIVAVVRGKEVDITSYLNRAEEFGKEIQPIKIKG